MLDFGIVVITTKKKSNNQGVEDVVDHGLERRWTITQSKKHNQWFKEPRFVRNAAFHSSSSFIWTLSNPHRTSSLVKYLAPLSLLMSLLMRGSGYLFLTVIAFRAR